LTNKIVTVPYKEKTEKISFTTFDHTTRNKI